MVRIQEMIGLCLFMMDLSRREAETSLESAHNVYQVTTDVSSADSLNSWRNAKTQGYQ